VLHPFLFHVIKMNFINDLKSYYVIGVVICSPENKFQLAPDVFEFIVLSNCRSILRSPGSTYGHLAVIFRKDLSNDFII